MATAYPVNVWAPGLGEKRKELFASCMARPSQAAQHAGGARPPGKAECDAEVARAYPVYLWAPGLKQKREELFAACMARGSTSNGAATPAFDKAECDAEIAKAYPVNLWAPGLGEKRKQLFAACMAKRGAEVPAGD